MEEELRATAKKNANDILTTKFETKVPTSKIVLVNTILSCKEYFQDAKSEYKKYLFTFGSILFLRLVFKISDPRSKFIKNNASIPKVFIDKNLLVEVALRPKSSYESFAKLSGENNMFYLKHIPYFNRVKSLVDTENSLENKDIRSVKKEDLLNVKLSGIKSISDEGRIVIERLIGMKPSFYLKFTNIKYNDQIDLYGWLFFKKRMGFFSSKENLNIFLVKNGYAEIEPINTNIYDEKIYYYYLDLVEADKHAKSQALGIWKNTRSHNLAESSTHQGSFTNFLHKMRKRVNMRTWEKVLLHKKHT